MVLKSLVSLIRFAGGIFMSVKYFFLVGQTGTKAHLIILLQNSKHNYVQFLRGIGGGW